MEKMQKEVAMVYFEAVLQHLPEETEGKNEEFPLWNVGVPASI
jgi:hypothetical protein